MTTDTLRATMRALLAAAALCLAAAGGLRAESATLTLLMFEEDGCPYCERWRQEVGVVYARTAEGARAPLTRVDLHGPRPDGVTLTSAIFYSPTFVLLKNGAEVGRIEGYPGEDFFWGLLGQLLRRAGG